MELTLKGEIPTRHSPGMFGEQNSQKLGNNIRNLLKGLATLINAGLTRVGLPTILASKRSRPNPRNRNRNREQNDPVGKEQNDPVGKEQNDPVGKERNNQVGEEPNNPVGNETHAQEEEKDPNLSEERNLIENTGVKEGLSTGAKSNQMVRESSERSYNTPKIPDLLQFVLRATESSSQLILRPAFVASLPIASLGLICAMMERFGIHVTDLLLAPTNPVKFFLIPGIYYFGLFVALYYSTLGALGTWLKGESLIDMAMRSNKEQNTQAFDLVKGMVSKMAGAFTMAAVASAADIIMIGYPSLISFGGELVGGLKDVLAGAPLNVLLNFNDTNYATLPGLGEVTRNIFASPVLLTGLILSFTGSFLEFVRNLKKRRM